MGPLEIFPGGQPIPVLQPTGTFAPGIASDPKDEDEYLASLDSDTRDYVLKHTSETRSQQDIVDCINKLHNGR